MGQGEKVAGYFRVGQARDDMKAPEIYREEIERSCRYRVLGLCEVFSDIDFSGYRGAKPRPALKELTRRRSEFSAVVIPKLSRFGRSVKDLVELFDVFDQDGVALVFLDMNVNSSTSQGRLHPWQCSSPGVSLELSMGHPATRFRPHCFRANRCT